MIVRDLASITLPAVTDLTGKEGFYVKSDGTGLTAVTAATDVPLGVVNSEAAVGSSAVVLVSGAFGGTTRVKLAATPGTVVVGSYLVLTADGSVKLDPGTGARVVVGRALESGGVAGERIEAVLINPVVYTA